MAACTQLSAEDRALIDQSCAQWQRAAGFAARAAQSDNESAQRPAIDARAASVRAPVHRRGETHRKPVDGRLRGRLPGRRTHLEVTRDSRPAELHRLVDDAHLGAHRHHVVQEGDARVVRADAGVAEAAADSAGPVRAVDDDARPGEIEREGAERIVGARRPP